MSDLPRAVLSEAFLEKMAGRRLIAAVFTTFMFEPGFFEEDVLPVFLDVPLSHVSGIRLAQLSDALRQVPQGIAVYYDMNGLVPDGRPAKLDIERVAVRHKNRVFHPKNVFALVEDTAEEGGETPRRALLVASLSANLTRAGWWANVEVGHIDEVREGDASRWRDDVRKFLNDIAGWAREKSPTGHAAIRAIRDFLTKKTTQREHRSAEGRLHPHFFGGTQSVPDFLEKVAGKDLTGMCLEVVSPYFGVVERPGAADSSPLAELIQRFEPKETRIFLPRDDKGAALCSRELHDWVNQRSNEREPVRWGKLPPGLLRGGKSEDAKDRFVHAKVYRFFRRHPRREVLFVGSVNLTNAAHRQGGNVESGFLVEVKPSGQPDFWLEVDGARPATFETRSASEGKVASGGSCLTLCFSWRRVEVTAFWDDDTPSPPLSVEAQGVPLFEIVSLQPRVATVLTASAAQALKRILISTSLLAVLGEGPEPTLLLVQETDMDQRPSLLHQLSPAEILRYWSLLTAEQRAVFLETNVPAAVLAGDALVSRQAPLATQTSLFDRFAGIFHAFLCLERAVRGHLSGDPADQRPKEAVYRLFGQTYDSLASLLRRVREETEAGRGDAVEDYVTFQCARQIIREIARDYPDFWVQNEDLAGSLAELCDSGADALRRKLSERAPVGMPAFLDWFDRWFLRRAKKIELEDEEG